VAAPPSLHDQPGSVEHRHVCDLRVVGYLSSGGGAWLGSHAAVLTPLPEYSDCESPLVLACSGCPRARAIACQSHSLQRCYGCASRYRRLVTRVVEGGLSDRSSSRWFLYLLTVTAPGSTPAHKRLTPMVDSHFLPIPGRRRECGCEASMTSIARWNAGAGECWNRLRTALRRAHPSLEFMRLVEDQSRGALHHHVAVASLTPLDPWDLQVLALAAGYGCSVDLSPVRSRSGTAVYLSKYATKQVGDRRLIPWEVDQTDPVTGEVYVSTRPTYRNVSRSCDWFLSMAAIKAILRSRVRSDRLTPDEEPRQGLEAPVPQAMSPPG
jgi:hypothetical protein